MALSPLTTTVVLVGHGKNVVLVMLLRLGVRNALLLFLPMQIPVNYASWFLKDRNYF